MSDERTFQERVASKTLMTHEAWPSESPRLTTIQFERESLRNDDGVHS